MAYGGELSTFVKEYTDKGAREAKEHRPPSDASSPDQHENALRMKADGLVNKEQQTFDTEANDASRVALDIRQKLIDFKNHAQQLISDNSLQSNVDVELAKQKNEISLVVLKRIKAEVDYRHLRHENGITAQADYPSSHVWHFAIILVCFLFESLANSFFFKDSDGFLNGFLVASLISLLNISTAAFLGFGWTYKNVADPKSKATGWVCLILYFFLTIFLNALFASYRSAYQLLADPSDTMQQFGAFKSSIAGAVTLHWHIADIFSFLLFAFGLILSGLAFWKGYTYDDKYPGHGRLHRILKDAENAEQEKLKLLRQKIELSLNQYRSQINSALNEPTQLTGAANAKHAILNTAKVNLKNQSLAIERDYKLVLDAYRNTNTAIRGCEPPQYYKTFLPLVFGDMGASAEAILTELKDVQSEISGAREHFQIPLNQKADEVKSRSRDILTKGLDDFYNEVVRAAKDKITADAPAIHREVS